MSAQDAPFALEACNFSFQYPDAAAGIGPLEWRVEQGAFQLLVCLLYTSRCV